MKFDLHRSDQVSYEMTHWHKGYYDTFEKGIKKTKWMRLTGLPIGLGLRFEDLVSKTANVGEALIKGLANIFGTFFSPNCSAELGIRQISLTLPVRIFQLAFWPVLSGGIFLFDFIMISFKPEKFVAFGLKSVNMNLSSRSLLP